MKVLESADNKNIGAVLHKHDKKILSLLCENIRYPISRIANLVKLSRQSVEYRIKVMQQHSLLVGSRSVINIQQLGFYSHHFFLNVHHPQSEAEFIERAKNNEFVNVLINYSGMYNFEVSIIARSAAVALHRFLDIIEGLQVVSYTPCIVLSTLTSKVLPDSFTEEVTSLKSFKNDSSFHKIFSAKRVEHTCDTTDKKIMKVLADDAQCTLTAIGKEVGLTNDGVNYRIKKLIQSGYIKGFRPAVNYSVLGLNIQSVLIKFSTRDRSTDRRFRQFLRENQVVLWATELFGGWDYLLYVIDKDQIQIHTFMQELKNEFSDNIQSYEILFAYREYKYSFMTKEVTQ
ncbi:MAG: Lrp/AsnC family leucine-responsive transcriptional regulator [Candidatus Woesearchaeota archaeon]|jgi:Lrp/AsnC family leucine-responsive transcriptional regulator